MVNFKVTIIVLLLAAVLATDCAPERGEAYEFTKRTCQQENGLPDDVVDYIQRYMTVKNTTDESEKCFVVCLLVAEGVVKNGELVVDKLVNDTKEDFNKAGLKLKEEEFRSRLEDCTMRRSLLPSLLLRKTSLFALAASPDESDGTTNCTNSYDSWSCFLKLLSDGLPFE
ncbi:uncharacterized protein [Periplaneta americana]|uniref:uncharacterized protein isoform X1 n=1 Tax=Periplaneta americana TaxID=6978 RepID=UPI0037E933AC